MNTSRKSSKLLEVRSLSLKSDHSGMKAASPYIIIIVIIIIIIIIIIINCAVYLQFYGVVEVVIPPYVGLNNCRFHFSLTLTFFLYLSLKSSSSAFFFFFLFFPLPWSILQWYYKGNLFLVYDQYKWAFYEGGLKSSRNHS